MSIRIIPATQTALPAAVEEWAQSVARKGFTGAVAQVHYMKRGSHWIAITKRAGTCVNCIVLRHGGFWQFTFGEDATTDLYKDLKAPPERYGAVSADTLSPPVELQENYADLPQVSALSAQYHRLTDDEPYRVRVTALTVKDEDEDEDEDKNYVEIKLTMLDTAQIIGSGSKVKMFEFPLGDYDTVKATLLKVVPLWLGGRPIVIFDFGTDAVAFDFDSEDREAGVTAGRVLGAVVAIAPRVVLFATAVYFADTKSFGARLTHPYSGRTTYSVTDGGIVHTVGSNSTTLYVATYKNDGTADLQSTNTTAWYVASSPLLTSPNAYYIADGALKGMADIAAGSRFVSGVAQDKNGHYRCINAELIGTGVAWNEVWDTGVKKAMIASPSIYTSYNTTDYDGFAKHLGYYPLLVGGLMIYGFSTYTMMRVIDSLPLSGAMPTKRTDGSQLPMEFFVVADTPDYALVIVSHGMASNTLNTQTTAPLNVQTDRVGLYKITQSEFTLIHLFEWGEIVEYARFDEYISTLWMSVSTNNITGQTAHTLKLVAYDIAKVGAITVKTWDIHSLQKAPIAYESVYRVGYSYHSAKNYTPGGIIYGREMY